MTKYNVLTPVVSIIEADSPSEAIAVAVARLGALLDAEEPHPFQVHEEGHDAFESEDQS